MRFLQTKHHQTIRIPTTTVSESDNVRETVSHEKKVENVNVTAVTVYNQSMNMALLLNLSNSNFTVTVDCGDFRMVESFSEKEVCFHYDQNKGSISCRVAKQVYTTVC